MRVVAKTMWVAGLLLSSFLPQAAVAGPVGVVSGFVPLCLDVHGAGRGNGTGLTMWFCHSGDNQRFQFMRNGEIRVYGNKCLDIEGGNGNNGTRVIIWDCHGGANQKWTRTNRGEIRGFNNKCLDIAAFVAVPGASRIHMWDCVGGSNQKWAGFVHRGHVNFNDKVNLSPDVSRRIAESNGNVNLAVGNNGALTNVAPLANVTPLNNVTP